MKTAPDDIAPHPNFQTNPDAPPDIQPEPGYPGVTPDPQPEIEPAEPGGDRIDQPATSPEVTPVEPTEIRPLP